MKQTTRDALLLGGMLGFSGLGIGIYLSANAIGEGYGEFIIFAPLAGFLTGWTLWLLHNRIVRYPLYFLGIAVGGFAGLASHYVCWYLMLVKANICYHVFDGCKGSLGDAPADLLYGLVGTIGLSFFSALFFGWITIPVGMIGGGMLVRYTKRRLAEEQEKNASAS